VALMTDSDNTGESAVGYYGDISLLRAPKAIDTQQKAKPGETNGKEQPPDTTTPAPAAAPQPSVPH
jgi:hypothetical protein